MPIIRRYIICWQPGGGQQTLYWHTRSDLAICYIPVIDTPHHSGHFKCGMMPFTLCGPQACDAFESNGTTAGGTATHNANQPGLSRWTLQASVHHPLWNNGRRCYNRFFGWAFGDGALITMYPQLCYWGPPNSAEACVALVLLSGTAAAAAAFLVVMASFASTCFIYSSQLWSAGMAPGVFAGQAPAALAVVGISPSAAWWFGAAGTAGSMAGCCSTVLLAAAVAFKLMDVVLDVARAFTPVSVHMLQLGSLKVALGLAALLRI